jgi:HNH endonuclease
VRDRDKARLQRKFTITDGCWEWVGSFDGKGYGKFFLAGKSYRAHRVTYEFYVGPIPDGLVIDHLCRNKRCVNPEHMEPVTQVENAKRGMYTEFCKAGLHSLEDERNLLASKNGRRRCKHCCAARQRARYQNDPVYREMMKADVRRRQRTRR